MKLTPTDKPNVINSPKEVLLFSPSFVSDLTDEQG